MGYVAIKTAADIDAQQLDTKQFDMGMQVELEHKDVTGGDPKLTAMIARAHLKEDPKYYTHLKEMEDKYSREGQDEKKEAAYLEGVRFALREAGLTK